MLRIARLSRTLQPASASLLSRAFTSSRIIMSEVDKAQDGMFYTLFLDMDLT